MDNPAVAAVLNLLLDIEQQHLVLRVDESSTFVSLPELRAGNVVRRMAQTVRKNRETLTEMILDVGGQPVPRRAGLMTANLHYLDLNSVLPQLLEAQESVVAQYKQLTPRLASDRRASELAAKILARHEGDLESLRAVVPTEPVGRAG